MRVFCPKHVAPGANGDLRDGDVGTNPVVHAAQLELGLDEVVDEVIETGRPAVDKGRQLVVDGHAIAANLNVHRCPPC